MSTESSPPVAKHRTASAVTATANQPVVAPVPSSAGSPAVPAAETSIGQLVHDATLDISTLIRGEVELAKLEVKSSLKSGGTGVVFFLIAAVIIVFALTFGFIALAEGLVALHIWRWAAYLIVFGALILFAGLFGFVGFKKVKKVRPPKRTIETTKDTVAYLRHPTKTP